MLRFNDENNTVFKYDENIIKKKKEKNKEQQKVDLGTVFWYNIQKKRISFSFFIIFFMPVEGTTV